MKKVIVVLAPGFEEIEAITPIDVLRRADIEVIVAGLTQGPITGSHGITVQPDTTIDAVRPHEVDMLILPGGMPGSEHLLQDERVKRFVQQMDRAGKYVCAICAAPLVLKHAGIVADRPITSHPGVQQAFPDLNYREDRVVRSGTLITSRGPGTALEFSLELVRVLKGDATADTLAAFMLAKQ